MSELKLCPFCGEKATVIDHRVDFYVQCGGCNVVVYGESVRHLDYTENEQEAQAAFDNVNWDELRQSAIDKWNARPDYKLTAQVEELKGFVKQVAEADVETFNFETQDGDTDCFEYTDIGVIEEANELLTRIGEDNDSITPKR